MFHLQFGRWSFLAVGVAYGAMHQSRLSKKAAKEREIEAKQKVIRDAKLAEEKARNSARKFFTCEARISIKIVPFQWKSKCWRTYRRAWPSRRGCRSVKEFPLRILLYHDGAEAVLGGIKV